MLPLEAHRLARGWSRPTLSKQIDDLYLLDGLAPPHISGAEICRWEHGDRRPNDERIDTRAAGGYVVAPPTGTADGRYRITDNRPPARLPDWFAELLTATPPPPEPPPPASTAARAVETLDRYVAAAIDGEIRRLAAAGPGTRNNTLFTVAVALGQLVGAGLLDHQLAHHTLQEAASGHVASGAYSHRQALQTIASGLHRGAQQPRHVPAPRTARAAS